MDSHYPSLFFKMTKYDKELFKKDTSITPIFKEGIQFVFFNAGKSKKAEDTTKSIIKRNLDALHKNRRTLKKLLRRAKKIKDKNEMNRLTHELDSIDGAIKSKRKAFQKDNKIKKKDNYLSIIKSFMNHITLKIDSIDYKERLNCKYYTHPSSGYKGFLCHFKSDSLTEGYHTISFERDYYRDRKDSVETYSAKLPFIKVE